MSAPTRRQSTRVRKPVSKEPATITTTLAKSQRRSTATPRSNKKKAHASGDYILFHPRIPHMNGLVVGQPSSKRQKTSADLLHTSTSEAKPNTSIVTGKGKNRSVVGCLQDMLSMPMDILYLVYTRAFYNRQTFDYTHRSSTTWNPKIC